jgi:hypothetical protein
MRKDGPSMVIEATSTEGVGAVPSWPQLAAVTLRRIRRPARRAELWRPVGDGKGSVTTAAVKDRSG